ncbi:MAG TPA: hypothetical protein PK854_05085 [Oscillospiraceae bacterium]|nr:hypothetical protein [Oscillospiraceae bacterium]
MKKQLRYLISGLLIFMILSTGCFSGGIFTGNQKNGNSTQSQSEDIVKNSMTDDQTTEEGTGITSVKAADLAYQEAVKWRSDAVLWDLQPVPSSLDASWASNDLAGDWIAGFVCKSDDKYFTVEIQGNEVTRVSEETYTTRKIDIPASLSVKRPGASMKEAAATAVKNGMPEHPMNILIGYSVESYTPEWNGKPVWEFAFTISGEAYCYAVDGATGKLIDIQDKEGNSVDPAQFQSNREKPPGDAKDAIANFITALDKGKSEDALGLMQEAKIENPVNKSGWKTGFDSIESVRITKIEAFLQDSWTDANESYKCSLSVTLKSGAQPGLWEDGEIVRYINVSAENGQWKISEISMNP